MSTKDTVLASLQATSDFVSGADLAAARHVSRTAIWKAIKALQADGYHIDAVSNRGYKLTAMPDTIDADSIAQQIAALGVTPGAVYGFAEIDSTNAECKRRCASIGAFRTADGVLTREGATLHRALVVAGKQTAGRGRMGRTFVSPPHAGVYFTLIYAPKQGVTNPALLTAAAAVAVARATDELFGTKAQIKWVNDIFLNGKKISGILTEGVTHFETGRIEAAQVGIGINVRDMGFTDALAAIATSITQAAPDPQKAVRISRNNLVAHIIAHLLTIYDAWEATVPTDTERTIIDNVLREYKARSFLIGKTVTVNPAAGLQGLPYTAQVIDIAPDAGLVVQLADGSKKILQSGEVSLHSADFVREKL